ncbi:MAG: DUF3365 domain-containing protein, partial [Bacteroidia bacterium]|nr:DUF3365 domain-containing protein [Bacteroidia bacterium]
PLTDSMSMRLNAKIKRVSDKNRNPENAANVEELAYIKQAKLDISENGNASPQTIEKESMIVGYYPIMTNQMCLQCHGNPGENIDEETLARIDNLYPADVARGYGPNELRGIWVVEMKK